MLASMLLPIFFKTTVQFGVKDLLTNINTQSHHISTPVISMIKYWCDENNENLTPNQKPVHSELIN